MKLSACVLLLVSLFSLPARAQKPPNPSGPYPSNRYQNGSYPPRMGSGPDAVRFHEQMDSLLMMEIRPRAESPLPIAGTVSARELLIPAKAVKEFKRGRKSYLTNDFKSSAEHFEKAVQMYPNFAEAHNNLGISYIMSGASEKSLDEFRRAIALDPKRTEAYSNFSLAFLLLKRYPDAESAARQALQIDPQCIMSLSLLGRSLAGEQHYTQEAVDSLRKSKKEIPEDRLMLVEVLLRRGELDQAVVELREDLKAAPDAEKQKVRCWLAQLTQTDISNACGTQ